MKREFNLDFSERELNKKGLTNTQWIILSVVIFLLVVLIVALPFISATHCSTQKKENCKLVDGSYCKNGNEIWYHSCKWSILAQECFDFDFHSGDCISNKQYCNANRLCTQTGKCIFPKGSKYIICENNCVDCPLGTVCMEKAPDGPGCVKSSVAYDTDALTLANIKKNLGAFLFPLLGLFVFIIILVFFVLRKKAKKGRKK